MTNKNEMNALERLNIDLNDFLNIKKTKKMRKAVLSDFISNVESTKFEPIKNDKPKNYRMQDEYGEKKFIKP